MKFRLDVDLAAITGDPAAEPGRILRYWGGATKQLDLTHPQAQDVYDSTYAHPVGQWVIEPAGASAPDNDRTDRDTG